MVRAGIYIRVSKAKRELLDAQRQQPPCEAFAKAQGWSVEEVYLDDSISAHSGVRRDSFERMLGDVRAGKLEAIISWQMDRLLRTVEDASAIVHIAKETGVLVANVGGSINLSTADGRKRFFEAAVAAQYESDLKSERLKLKHAEIAAAGGWQGGQRPFGYDLIEYRDGSRIKYQLESNPGEAAAIQKAVQEVLQGRSISAITKEWAQDGRRRPNGGFFKEQGIKELLVNPRLAGLRRVDSKLITAVWPAIITRDQHEELTAILKVTSHGGGKGGQRSPRSYLLPGFVFCGNCGARLRSKASEGKRRYVCDPREGGCGGLKRLAEPLEAHVVFWLLDKLPQRLLEATRRAPEHWETLGRLLTARQTAQDRLDGLEDLLTDGLLDRPGYVRQRRRLKAKLEELDQQVTHVRAQAPRRRLRGADLSELQAEWEQLDLDEQRALLSEYVSKVVVKPVGRGRKRYPQGEYTEIIWR